MKTGRQWLVFALTLSKIINVSEADTLFSDGFEGNAVGTVPPQNWEHIHGWGGNGMVTASPVNDGVRAFQIDDASGLTSGFQTSSFTEKSGGKIEWEWYIRPTQTDQQIECHITDINSYPAATVLFRTDGKVGYGVSGSWNTATSESYLANEWNHIFVQIDLDTHLWNLSVNGNMVATGLSSGNPGGANVGVANRIIYQGGSVAQTTFYIDDVTLANISEPALEPGLVFFDGYEANALGVVPPQNWMHTRGWGGNGVVTNLPVHEGVRAFQIDDVSGLSSGFQTSFTEQSAWKVEWEWYIRPTAADQQIECLISDVNSTLAAGVILREDGKIGYIDRSLWSNTTAESYLVNEWNHIFVQIDLDTQLWNLSVNGTVLATDIETGNPSVANTGVVNTIIYQGGSVAQTTFYIDDVRLSLIAPQGPVIIIQ